MSNQLVSFDQILDQDSAIESITRAYKLGRLPHGMIFAGPVGVGKATTALAMAGLFLCEKPGQLSACGACPSCRSLAAGSHPDYHVIYRQLARLESEKVKAKELSADVIRDFLVAKAAMKSVVGVGKVFVVEEADLMNATAQNALLKTLEEPAGRTLIVLLSDQPEALLPTIRSRCQTIRFGSLDEKTVREQLRQRGISAELAARAATAADGSLGLALRWIEDGVVEPASRFEDLLTRIADGAEPAIALQDWFKSASESFAEKQLERDPLSSKDQATREGLVLYLVLASQFFRRRLGAPGGDPQRLERYCAAIDAVVRAETYLESNVNISLVLQQFASSLERAFRGELV